MDCWKSFVLGLGFIFLLFFGIPIQINKSAEVSKDPDNGHIERQFQKFVNKFNKSYHKNETLYQQRFKIFQQSLDAIEKLNSQRKHPLEARYGITKYSDLTPEEFTKKHLKRSVSKMKFRDKKRKRVRRAALLVNSTSKIDWREKGVVTSVKNQKLCGACWAFSVIENMETMSALKTGVLKELSTQQLIDCAGYDNDGCNGGDSCALLEWLADYKIRVAFEADYPLQLKNDVCKSQSAVTGVQVERFACTRLVGDEDIILMTLARVGPVATAINALSWQNYLGGVIQYHCGSDVELLNHAVQIVGYDLTSEIPYYIVRNSWGPDFGHDGYLYIAIGKNMCGLANEVSVLTVAP